MLETYRNLIPALYNELKELHAAGVPLLAGSDAAVLFAYPGSSLHAELESLVEDIGLTPAEALQAATTTPADFWGMSDHLGGVKPGHLADLVLLDANPLDSITNTRRIAGVVLAGQWFDRAALDRLVETAEQESTSQQPAIDPTYFLVDAAGMRRSVWDFGEMRRIRKERLWTCQ